MAEPQPQKQNVPAAGRDLTGTTVGRFAVRARIGSGGMGEVYRADDTKLKRAVALKRLSPELRADEQYRQRLVREAVCAARLSNPNIAGVYDVLESDGEMFLVMEYVEGQTLRHFLSGCFAQSPPHPPSPAEFLAIAYQCLRALSAAHGDGILHRDIKPENIMLTPKQEVKILDFGVARRLTQMGDTLTRDPAFSEEQSGGTLAYMAPEVLLGEAPDARADIFSLGLVFYEVLTGRHPFKAPSALATSNRILHEEPAPLRRANPQVPVEIERVLLKMLAKDPRQRYARAEQVLEDLRASSTAEAGAAAAFLRLGRRPGRAVASIAAAVVVLVVGLALVPPIRERAERWFGLARIPTGKNVAVLPFNAVGGDAQTQALCDGLVDTLTAKLSQLTERSTLEVVPTREVRSRGVFSVEQARREFGVNLALEGSWHQSGDTVRVNYALVDAQTGRQLRAGTITAAALDPFAVEDRVVREVIQALELELNQAEQQAISSHGTQVARAYDAYLQGRGYLQDYDKPENIEKAISVFGSALAFDPSYALAHTGLGEAYWQKYLLTKDSKWVEAARSSCARALELDAHLGAAHICLGRLQNGTGKPDAAVGEFEWALGSEPTSDDAYRGLAYAYQSLGRPEEAERTYRRAISLRPHYWGGYSWLGAFLAHEARYAEAIDQFRQAISLAPDNAGLYRSLGGVYALKGDYAEATAVLRRAIELRPTFEAYTNLGYVYFSQRRFSEVVPLFEEAFRLHPKEYRACGNLARVYYWAPGTRGKAFEMYKQAIELAQEQLRINPRDADLHTLLASFYAMTGRHKEAIDHIRTALKLLPDDPEYLFYAALVYSQAGDRAKALDSLDKALARGYPPAQIEATIEHDSLRGDPGFQALLKRKN